MSNKMEQKYIGAEKLKLSVLNSIWKSANGQNQSNCAPNCKCFTGLVEVFPLPTDKYTLNNTHGSTNTTVAESQIRTLQVNHNQFLINIKDLSYTMV